MLHRMNAKQCKMARDGLGKTGRELAELSGVPYATLARFEADGCRFTLFPDGRTLVEGTDDTGRAQALVARWIGA